MKIIAHRSGTDRYPEQTILSARHSLAAGADLIEIDIRFSSDGVPVIQHDGIAERLFGTPEEIGKLTAREFLALRRKEDPAFCSHLFTDYTDCGIRKILFHVKVGGEMLPKLLDLCEERGLLKEVVFGVHSVGDVKTVKSRGEDLRVLAFMPSADQIGEFAAAGADFIRLWEKWCTEENLAAVRSTGKKLWIMTDTPTVGETEESRYALYEKWGADGILVNQVLPAVKYYRP